MPQFEVLAIEGAWRLLPELHGDDRGWFARYFCREQGGMRGLETDFVQLNHSFSQRVGTVRGLHLQIGAGAEAKLIKCLRGRVHDVLLDLRRGSPTFLRHVAVELSASNRVAAYVPPGVAHGFQALENDTELLYHHTNYYRPQDERGVRYDDPRAAIEWPLPAEEVSAKDRQWPLLGADFLGFAVASATVGSA